MTIINQEAPVKCKKSITINARAEKIWSIMTRINDWAEWQTDISQPKLDGEPKPGATFHWKTGGAKIHSTLHTVEPFKRFGWTGKTFGMFAIHNWTLDDKGGQTQVSVEESMEGLLARIFKKAFNKNLERGMQTWLHLLKAACEK